jgi:DNA-binding SARP family transcriptional activator
LAKLFILTELYQGAQAELGPQFRSQAELGNEDKKQENLLLHLVSCLLVSGKSGENIRFYRKQKTENRKPPLSRLPL